MNMITPLAILSAVLLPSASTVAAFSTPPSSVACTRMHSIHASAPSSSALRLSSSATPPEGDPAGEGTKEPAAPAAEAEAAAAPAPAASVAPAEPDVDAAKQLLCRAAETKREKPSEVVDALYSLERHCKAQFRDDPAAFSEQILANLSGSWRLVLTTGTKERQRKYGKAVAYFPLKAIQKFDATTEPKFIENGIYGPLGLPLVRFTGDFDFDVRRRKLEFDFDRVVILGSLTFELSRKEVAQIGATTGLGSANNEKLADRGKRAFFDWISADADIATARGGGGGLALWKRVAEGDGPGYGEGPV